MTQFPAGLEGSEIACRTLQSLGVTHAFGLPGTQTVPLFEALRRSDIRTIVPTSELTASFMAGAFYRASGRPALLLTIPGPGFTHALTGLAEARLDSAAMIHLTVAEPEGPGARFRLQAIPQRIIGNALAKGTFTVQRIEDIDRILRMAYECATTGGPGPVIVAFAEGLAEAQGATGVPSGAIATAAATTPDRQGLADGWARVIAARRPLIYAGQGAHGCAARVQALAESLGAPVMTTPSGRGVLPETHELAMPFDSCRGGLDEARSLMSRADLVLVLGAKLGHNGSAGRALPFQPERTLQVDADPDVCGKSYDVSGITATIEQWFDAAPASVAGHADWTTEELQQSRAKLRRPSGTAPEPLVNGREPAHFFDVLRRALPENAVLVTDTGLHQILTRRHFEVLAPGGLLTPTDFQSMGFGLPAAIAAAIAVPDRQTVALVGDGSLAMNGLELSTAAQLGLPLPVIVFVDGFLNQIRMHQRSDYGHESGVALPPLDLAALADATGVHFADGEQITDVLHAAFRQSKPTLIAVPVGDSAAVRRVWQVRRAKNLARAAFGDRLRSLLGPRRG